MYNTTHREKSITCLLARDRAADSLFFIILFCLLSTVFSTTIPEATLFRPSVCVSDNPVEGVGALDKRSKEILRILLITSRY